MMMREKSRYWVGLECDALGVARKLKLVTFEHPMTLRAAERKLLDNGMGDILLSYPVSGVASVMGNEMIRPGKGKRKRKAKSDGQGR